MTADQERQERYDRLARYHSLRYRGEKFKSFLGSGTDGEVWKSANDTAMKVFQRDAGYCNERDVYLRLGDYGLIRKIDDFWVPRLIDYDDELRIVEMSLMQDPPYIIDFAKVYFDFPKEFPEDVLDDAEKQGRERFEHNWPAVKSLLATLETFGIFYADPNRGNITFPDMP